MQSAAANLLITVIIIVVVAGAMKVQSAVRAASFAADSTL